MSDNKGALNPFNLAALMLAGGFMVMMAFNPLLAVSPQPDNRKRDSLLADLQHGLRDEDPIRCDEAITRLAGEFGDQEYVYGCLTMAVHESFEMFGPEIAYRIIQNIERVSPGSKLNILTQDLGKTLPAYCDVVTNVRSETFKAMAKVLGNAGIPLSVMDRRDVVDLKVTHKDQRRYISPAEFSARYLEPKPKALG
jgi:hypothetical protein